MKQEPKSCVEILDLLDGYATSKGDAMTIAREFFGPMRVVEADDLAEGALVFYGDGDALLVVARELSPSERSWCVAEQVALVLGASEALAEAFAGMLVPEGARPLAAHLN